jgi:Fe-S-cluster containining protein
MAVIKALQAIYKFYDDFITRFPVACGPGCTSCCSVNVSVTSLEVDYIRKNKLLAEKEIQRRITAAAVNPHFIPTLTTNQLARFCLGQQQPPEETGMHSPGQCPLLGDDGLCQVYANRPFSCRAMLSASRCRADGEAIMEPFLFTINLALYQMIEHLDLCGTSGNMLDMLAGDENHTIANSGLPGFLVSPVEQPQFHQLLKKIKKYPVGNEYLTDFFPARTFSPQ